MNTMLGKKIIFIFSFAILFLIFGVGSVLAGKVMLPADKKVKVTFAVAEGKQISSKNLLTGLQVSIRLEEPIMISDKVIVEKGAEGRAEVLEIVKPSKPGKPGKIKVGFISLSPKGAYKTLDGSDIKLTGEWEVTGKSKKLLSYIFIFGLFIKGGHAELSPSAIYEIKIGESIRLTND